MNKNKVIVNMVYRDHRGRRISAFGEVFGCKLVISIWKCSLSDQFSRKFSWNIWNNHEGLTIQEVKDKFGVTIEQYTIETNKGREKRDFNDWLASKYYVLCEVPVVMKTLVPSIERNYYQLIASQYKKK